MRVSCATIATACLVLLPCAAAEQPPGKLRAQCMRIGLIAVEWEMPAGLRASPCVLCRGAGKHAMAPHATPDGGRTFYLDSLKLDREGVYRYQLRRAADGGTGEPLTPPAVAANSAELAVGGDFQCDEPGTAGPLLLTGATFRGGGPEDFEVVAPGRAGSTRALRIRGNPAAPVLSAGLPELRVGGGTEYELSVWVKAPRSWHNVLGGVLLNADRKPCAGQHRPDFQAWPLRRDDQGWIYYHALTGPTPDDAAVLNVSLTSYKSGFDMLFDDLHVTDRRVSRLDRFDARAWADELDKLLSTMAPVTGSLARLKKLAADSREKVARQVQEELGQPKPGLGPAGPRPPAPESKGSNVARDILDDLDSAARARQSLPPLEAHVLATLRLMEEAVAWKEQLYTPRQVKPAVYNRWLSEFDRALRGLEDAKWTLKLIGLRYEK